MKKQYKLRVYDYAFTYRDKSLSGGYISYEQINDFIEFSLSADDDFGNQITFNFSIEMTLDSLNKLNDEPTKINESVIKGHVFLWNSSNQEIQILDDPVKTEKIYRPSIYFFAQKNKDNNFGFKIHYPEDEIFIWFNADFN